MWAWRQWQWLGWILVCEYAMPWLGKPQPKLRSRLKAQFVLSYFSLSPCSENIPDWIHSYKGLKTAQKPRDGCLPSNGFLVRNVTRTAWNRVLELHFCFEYLATLRNWHLRRQKLFCFYPVPSSRIAALLPRPSRHCKHREGHSCPVPFCAPRSGQQGQPSSPQPCSQGAEEDLPSQVHGEQTLMPIHSAVWFRQQAWSHKTSLSNKIQNQNSTSEIQQHATELLNWQEAFTLVLTIEYNWK